MRTIFLPAVLLAPALIAGALLGGFVFADDADETESEIPVLSIFSELGVDQDVKLYNEEPVTFMARSAGRANGVPLRGVTFVLQGDGGAASNQDDVWAKSSDGTRWGSPPSSLSYPPDRKMPVGRYRLKASKPGWKSAEIKLVKVEFGYQDLKAERTRDCYKASFGLQYLDCTETRRLVPVKVLIETANGGLLDCVEGNLVRNLTRIWLFESKDRVRISSRVETPDRHKPPEKRSGLLKVVPLCRLVLVIDEVRFPYPVPLPKAKIAGEVRPGDVESGTSRGGGRGR